MTIEQKPAIAATATAQQNHAKAAEHHDAAAVAHKEAECSG